MIPFILAVLSFIVAQPPAPPAPAVPANPAIVAQARTDEHWVRRNDSFNARAREGHAQGNIGMIFLGDSITEGWKGGGGGGGRAVWEKMYRPRQAVNFGISGDRTQHVLWRIEHGNLDGLAKPERGGPPRLVVIMIGTNNTGADSAEQIAAGIKAVVEAARAKLPETPVLLLGVFPRGEKADDPARKKITEINRLAAKLDDGKNIAFLDIGAKFLAESSDGLTLSREVMPDFLHLSEKGYQIWADAIEAKVGAMLGEG